MLRGGRHSALRPLKPTALPRGWCKVVPCGGGCSKGQQMTTEMSDVIGKAIDILHTFVEENDEWTNEDLLEELKAKGYTLDEDDLRAVLIGLLDRLKQEPVAARQIAKALREMC